ncbi:TonB-dependent receptor [Trinickia symbiotica]|uniref:TonB-dependent receptor n=1 Tax=Trinickia symbiotica TaxID=863227 RepID=A0A2N7X6I6_9BURK|nr:TonB-dependent receptor [Trinickia symbiotica]PMS37220.1 TonB-dependent receptor [Trinickia symbiotica]PPK42711.1 TonB-dependent receptor [Trinickia symbiotica]
MFDQQVGRRYWRLSALAFATAAAWSSLACAAAQVPADETESSAAGEQTTDKDQQVQRFGHVDVTRKRAVSGAAVATKQTQDRVMDVLTKEQIETLPDATVTEVVKRVAGVSVSFNSDNVNGRDEAQFVAIRGLDASYNNISFDGAPMASTDQTSRGVRTNMLPSSLVKQVQVFKTWQPDQDPNAVGGSVNIVTRSAFDNGGKPYFSATGALGHADATGKVLSGAEGLARKADMAWSATFGPSQAVGLVIAANYEKQNTYSLGHMTTDNIFYNFYNANGSLANPAATGGANLGNGLPVPQQFKYWQYRKNLERQGVDAKLEAKFTPDVYGFVSLGYNVENMHELRDENIIDVGRTTGVSSNPVINQTATSGQFALGEAEAGVQQSKIDRTVENVQGGLDWHLGDDRILSFRSSFSKASQWNPQTAVKYIYGNLKYGASGTQPSIVGIPGMATTYDTSGFDPAVSVVNPSGFVNPANWQPLYWRTDNIRIDDRVGDLKLDFRQNMDPDSRGLGYAIGVDYRSLGHNYNEAFNAYFPTGSGMTMAGVGGASGTTLPYTNGLPFMTIDLNKAWQQLLSNGSLVAANVNNLASSLQNDYSHTEQTAAGYAMASWRTDRLSAMIGLRQDNTRLSTTGNVRNTVGGTTTWQSVTNDSKYNFTLPAASLVFDATPAVRLKLAASKTIGRPTYDDYAPNTSISESSDGSLTVVTGNPNIKPRESTNLDLSAEWYLPHSGLVSLAAFHKQIKNEIYSLTRQGTLFYDGLTRTASITQPLNSSSSKLDGIELNFVQSSLGWLTRYLQGFGFSGNLTLLSGRLNAITSSGSTRTINRLVNQPDQIRNLSIFYNYRKFGITVAYNWIGTSLRAVDASLPRQDVYWQARKEIDLQARYDIGSGWQTFFEVANLTGSPVVAVTGQNRNLLKDKFSIGRTFWLGLTYTPKHL